MTTSRGARAIAGALGLGLTTTSGAAWAENATSSEERGAATEERRIESVRVDLGIALGGVSGLGGSSSGAGLVPLATAALEGHLVGPAWLVVSGHGSHGRGEDASGTASSATSVGLRVGPRFEWPVVDRFDAGFHVLASGGFRRWEVDGGDDVDAVDLGGVAGASIHFRATQIFGVRVAFDVVRGGWSQASGRLGRETVGYVHVQPSPAAELTFTF